MSDMMNDRNRPFLPSLVHAAIRRRTPFSFMKMPSMSGWFGLVFFVFLNNVPVFGFCWYAFIYLCISINSSQGSHAVKNAGETDRSQSFTNDGHLFEKTCIALDVVGDLFARVYDCRMMHVTSETVSELPVRHAVDAVQLFTHGEDHDLARDNHLLLASLYDVNIRHTHHVLDYLAHFHEQLVDVPCDGSHVTHGDHIVPLWEETDHFTTQLLMVLTLHERHESDESDAELVSGELSDQLADDF